MNEQNNEIPEQAFGPETSPEKVELRRVVEILRQPEKRLAEIQSVPGTRWSAAARTLIIELT